MTEETINEIQWTIHQTHPELVKPAREKLSEGGGKDHLQMSDTIVNKNIAYQSQLDNVHTNFGVYHFCQFFPDRFHQLGVCIVDRPDDLFALVFAHRYL